MSERGLLILIDGNNLMHRCLLGGQPLHRDSDGAGTHAALSFAQNLAALLAKYNPEHGLVAFDGPGPSFRALLSEDYKGNRERRELTADDEQQVGWMRHLADACGLAVRDSHAYEADDVIATAATRWEGRVVIAGDDKDLQALVSDRVRVHLFRDGSEVGPDQVREKRGVDPAVFSDLLAIAGDGTDGHGGMRGVGPVAATALLKECGSVEKALLAGPTIKAVAWKRLQADAPRMAAMAAVTRLVRYAHVDASPSAVSATWRSAVARFLLALEAPSTLDRFCAGYRVTYPSAPDPTVASRAQRAFREKPGRRLFR